MSSLLKALGYKKTVADSQERWIEWQNSLDTPEKNTRILPPAPKPSLAQRPRSFSVTQIGTWLRNPYSIYARKILKLRPLEVLDAEPIAADRGSFIHKALENFIKEGIPDDVNRARDALVQHGKVAFGPALERPAVWAFWWPRFLKIVDYVVELELKQSGNILSANAEIPGSIPINSTQGPVKLTAIADRIDHEIGGVWSIIDYKTGALPTNAEMLSGFAPQLPLEGLILRRGGFLGISAQQFLQLKYIKLTGGDPAGTKRVWDKNINDIIDASEEGLLRLILAFDSVETPYLASPDPSNKLSYDDYEHLARVKEWSS
jgi:ATP-dependent helicase/nuclease subunit B